MKRLLTGLVVMLVIAVAAVFMVMQNHKNAYSAKISGHSECASANKAQPSSVDLSGKVLETMDSGGYTYVLLETASGEKWVAAPKIQVEVGRSLSFAPGMVMADFKSETLNRTFSEIVFSSGLSGEATPGAAPVAGECPGGHGSEGENAALSGGAAMGGMAGSMTGMGSMKSSGRITVPPLDLAIEKAEGQNAFTVAELFARAAELNQQKITVRGKVVKVSSHIMGKNWVHLQDGSGVPENGTHDLVLTTQQQPVVGEILVAAGTLSADKDFGSGYRYDVIIEETEFK
ncbi:MAG: DNA-binding protein [Deltaproteobacteria bacterium]|nr:DNA-binding protein [Deltaproteobacteria bacterium]